MLAISIVTTLIWVTTATVRSVIAWLAEQVLIVVSSCTMAKLPRAFTLGLWNTGTNPDLAFANVDPYSCLPDRRVLEKFSKSQHRPSLITTSRFALSVPNVPVK